MTTNDDLNSRYLLKYPDFLEFCRQTRINDHFEHFPEQLQLHNIREINQFTSLIPLSVFFLNSEMASSYFSFASRSEINQDMGKGSA